MGLTFSASISFLVEWIVKVLQSDRISFCPSQFFEILIYKVVEDFQSSGLCCPRYLNFEDRTKIKHTEPLAFRLKYVEYFFLNCTNLKKWVLWPSLSEIFKAFENNLLFHNSLHISHTYIIPKHNKLKKWNLNAKKCKMLTTGKQIVWGAMDAKWTSWEPWGGCCGNKVIQSLIR